MSNDAIDFVSNFDLEGPRQRILIAVDVDITDANALLANVFVGDGKDNAAPGAMLTKAAVNAIAASSWPAGVEVKAVHATLQGFTDSKNVL